MKSSHRGWRLGTLGIVAALLGALSGCVATGPGYGGEVGIYGGDYYEPDGYEYGRWHPGYHVAPPRREEAAHPHIRGEETHASRPAYRPAPPSRPAPSIPSRSSRSH